jgi:hypothetical protein
LAWNIKEVLANMIANERSLHAWITGLIEGQEPDFNLSANPPIRISAIVSAFPGVERLVEELACNQAETTALVATLPPEFVTRKRSYWRLGYNLLDQPVHSQEQLDQIRQLIEAARKAGVEQTNEVPGEV